MKFDIVDRDTARVVGAVPIGEGRFINAMEDRVERNEPKGNRVDVVNKDGSKTTFDNMRDAIVYALGEECSDYIGDIRPREWVESRKKEQD